MRKTPTPAERKIVARACDELANYEAATVRAAQLLDYVLTYRFLLPGNAEFERLMLEHVKWVDKQRNAGRLPAAQTIKRPVHAPKARKSIVCRDDRPKTEWKPHRGTPRQGIDEGKRPRKRK